MVSNVRQFSSSRVSRLSDRFNSFIGLQSRSRRACRAMGVLPKNWNTVLTGGLANQERLCTSQISQDRDCRPLMPAWAQHGLHRPLTPDERRALRSYTSPRSPRHVEPMLRSARTTAVTAMPTTRPSPGALSEIVSWPETAGLAWRPSPPTLTGFDFKPPKPITSPGLYGHNAFSSPLRPQSARSHGEGSQNRVNILECCSWDDRGGRCAGNMSPRDIVRDLVSPSLDFSRGSGPPSRYFPTTKR